jgi:hypothetical protein
VKPFSLARLTALILVSFSAIFACATTYTETMAWQRLFNTAAYDDTGSIDVDAGGNTYLWYKAVEATDQYRLSRLSPTGAVYLSQYQTFDNQSQNRGVLAAPDNYIYTGVVNVSGGLANYSRITKYGAGLNVIWTHDFSTSGAQSNLVCFDVDKLGTVYAVVTKSTSNSSEVDFVRLSPSNTVLGSTSATDIIPFIGTRVGNRWLLNGSPVGVDGAKWAFYDETTAAETGGQSDTNMVDSTGMGQSIYYSYKTCVIPNTANVIVVRQQNIQTGITGFSYMYSVSEVENNGTVPWNSTGFEGIAGSAATNGENQPVYLNVGGVHIQALLNGNQQWEKDKPLSLFALDSTGFFDAYPTDNFGNSIVISRYDLVGTEPPLWKTTFSPVGFNNTFSSSPAQLVVRGNVLYALTELYDKNTGYDLDIRRFVSGPVLSTITPSTGGATVKAGGTITLKVSLNQAAGAGGIPVALTSSSSKLLFANNTQSLTLAIPNGSLYGFVTMHAPAGPNPTPTVVTGTENGIVKTLSVTTTN